MIGKRDYKQSIQDRIKDAKERREKKMEQVNKILKKKRK